MRFCGWGCLLRVLAVSPGPMSASPSVLAIRYCVMGGLLVMVVILGLEGWGNASGGRVGEFAEQIGGPVEIGGLEEMRGEAVRPVLGQDRIDALLAVGIGRTAERKRDRAQAQLEQPVAPRRLQIIMPFRRRPADQLDLSVVEPDPLLCCARVRLERAVVGEAGALRAAC